MDVDISFEYWKKAWTATGEDFTERLGEDGLNQPFRSAKAKSKSPEDKDWWFTNGFEMFKSYQQWRARSDWKVWTTPTNEPAIELYMNVQHNDFSIKMTLDRVMELPNGDLVVLDVKTGSRTPSTFLQLGFYAVGVELIYGVRPKYGSYWMARKGEPTEPASLDFFSKERILSLAEKFDRQRKQGNFLPNIQHCSICGYTKHCEWFNKEEDKTNV